MLIKVSDLPGAKDPTLMHSSGASYKVPFWFTINKAPIAGCGTLSEWSAHHKNSTSHDWDESCTYWIVRVAVKTLGRIRDATLLEILIARLNQDYG
jgi:hypothetical protein